MDYLIELGKDQRIRELTKALGLDVPFPVDLKRHPGPVQKRELAGRKAVIRAASPLGESIGHMLATAGAEIRAIEGPAAASIGSAAEGYGVPFDIEPESVEKPAKAGIFVFDATGCDTPEDLAVLYRFFQPRMRSLELRTRALVVTTTTAKPTPAQEAVYGALEGFTRSLAKEIGKLGATANCLLVSEKAAGEAATVARFFLSDRASFLTSVILHVTGDALK